MGIKRNKTYFLIASLFLALPSTNIIFNKACNFFNDYLLCHSEPENTIKVVNFIYLSIVFLVLSSTYYSIIKSKSEVPLKFIFITLLLFFATTSFATTDIFYYRGVAESEIKNNTNPYNGKFVKEIKFLSYTSGDLKPVMYPPGYLQLNKVIYKVAPKSDFSIIYTYKLFALITFFIAYLLIKKYKSINIATAFVLNPLFLFEFVANAHLDVYFIFFIVTSILLLLKNKSYLSIYSLFLASLIKFNALIIVPLYALYKFFKSKTFLQYCYSTVTVLVTLLLGFATIVLFYKPYWFGKDTLLGISLQADWPYNSIFERVVFTNLNPYKLIGNQKMVGQSFRDIWLFLVLVGGLIFGIHLLKNIKLKDNFKKIIKLDFSITKNSVLFYSGFLMLIFPIFGLRYFLPWYLTWSAIYFIFAKFKNRKRVLFLQTLIMAIYYPVVYILGHFETNINNTLVNNVRFIFQVLLFTTIISYLYRTKVKIFTSK